MDFISAYCCMSYLDNITRKSSVDHLDIKKSISNSREQNDLSDLIFSALKIKTDVNPEQIKEKASIPLINHLIKTQRIVSESKSFEKLRSDANVFFNEINESFSLFFLSDYYGDENLQKWQANSGFHFFNCNSNTSDLFYAKDVNFNYRETKNWEFAKDIFSPHNSLLIANPYLFSANAKSSLLNFLNSVVPEKLLCSYHLTLIGNDETNNNLNISKKEILKTINEIKTMICKKVRKIIVEYHFYNGKDFHNRYIISNNVFVQSGYGLNIINDKYTITKDDTWNISPLLKNDGRGNFNFKVFLKEKLNTVNEWISKSDNPRTNNRLLLNKI